MTALIWAFSDPQFDVLIKAVEVIALAYIAYLSRVNGTAQRDDARAAAVRADNVAAKAEEVKETLLSTARAAVVRADKVAAKAEEVKETLLSTAREVAVRADKVVAKAEEVKETLLSTGEAQATTLASIQETANATHVLVNNAHGMALAALATAAERIAFLTGATTDIEAASRTRTASDAHNRRQEAVDTSGFRLPPIPSSTKGQTGIYHPPGDPL